MKVRLKDIAGQAGVSIALVSNYLRNHQAARMSQTTRARIEKALAELDYQPSWAARTLRTGKSNIIGLVATMLNYEVNQSEMLALFNEAVQRGFQLFVQYTGECPERLPGAVKTLLAQGCDMVIISGNLTDEDCRALSEFASKVLLINSNKTAEIPGRTLRYDYESAVLEALDDLAGQGHKNICYLCNKEWRIDQRMNAFLTRYPEENLVDCNFYKERSQEWFEQLLNKKKACTAFFCINDFIALELMQYMLLSNRKVPQDYSVLGFDNVHAAALTVPSLSSIARPLTAVARKVLDRCEAIIKDSNHEFVVEIFKCIYIPRSSTAPVNIDKEV